jgi:putative flippase GtrA
VVWATTRWLLGQVDPDEDSLARLALWGSVSGALDGIVFLLGIVLGLGLPTALVTSLQLLSIVLVAAIGTPIAAVVGAVVGLTGLVVDLAVLWAADHIRPRPRPDRR